jgi:hypothetical protein
VIDPEAKPVEFDPLYRMDEERSMMEFDQTVRRACDTILDKICDLRPLDLHETGVALGTLLHALHELKLMKCHLSDMNVVIWVAEPALCSLLEDMEHGHCEAEH